MGLYNLSVVEVKRVLHGLRLLRHNGVDETEEKAINALICKIMSEAVGPLRHLEPFMRESGWIRDEIIYERKPDARRNSVCECKQPCRGKKCAECWHKILLEIHGTPGHVCRKF